MDNKTIIIHPTSFLDVGISTVTIVLNDGYLNSTSNYSFKIAVGNTAPVFKEVPTNQSLRVNQTIEYALP